MTMKSTITENNINIMDELLSGKYLQASFSAEGIKRLEEKTKLNIATAYTTLKKLEKMGIVVGYIPIISEDGKRILDNFKRMYGMAKEDSLIEMVKD